MNMSARPRTAILPGILLLILMSGASHTAFAGPVKVQSILIVPTETTVGRHPEIKGSIAATPTLARGTFIKLTIIAKVVQPDHVVKSWTWNKVTMRAGDIRSFTIPKEYDMKLAGTYKVDFNVYTRDRRPLHTLSKTFVAVDLTRPPLITAEQEVSGPRHKAIPPKQEILSPAETRHVGFGMYANTFNGTGGATVLLWPFKHVGFQGSYTAGSFRIAEGRLLVRLPLFRGMDPYLGAGYMKVSTERSVEGINIETGFQDTGPSAVIGAEIPFSKRLCGYIEISGASIDLKKEVTSGSITGTASVAYDPVTIGLGIVYFLF